MATSNPTMAKTFRSKLKDDHLTCAICLEHFKTPKALPCLHTFCENCIRDYVYGRNFDTAGKFPCPNCQKETIIPANGVSGFPDNFHVTSLYEALGTPARPPPPMNNNHEQTTIPSCNPLYPSIQNTVTEKGDQKEFVYVEGDGILLKFGHHGGTLNDFHKPYGLAVGPTGQFAISDRSGSRILVFSSTGILLSRITCANSKISSLAIMHDGNILVAVSNAGSAIMHLYNMDGKLLQSIGEHYRFARPSGIAMNSTHQIYITDLESHCVMIFTDQKKFSTKFGLKGTGDNRFMSPNFLATNQKNQIIVSDCENNCIQVFDHSGNFKLKFGSSGEDHGQLMCPMGVTTDSQNNIIVADAGNFRVEIFDKKGKHIKCLVKDTETFGNEAKPLNVAVTHKEDIAVLFVGEQFAEVRVFRWLSS